MFSLFKQNKIYKNNKLNFFIRNLFIRNEITPNPNVMKYIPDPKTVILPEEYGICKVFAFFIF